MDNLSNERRDRTRLELQNLIKDRTQVLSQYCLLAGTCSKAANDNIQETDNDKFLLQEFCENLIDYLARGHFELYQRINNGAERRQDIVELANKFYPRISATTDYAVDFNDAYDQSLTKIGSFDHYGERLSKLGEELAIRFELEDKLISSLLAASDDLPEALSA
ncbi:MAG: sigma D regulator [Gammaproteobacteria bacterium]|nr:sigma D regulator [Gammaproteobacteria bacterium]